MLQAPRKEASSAGVCARRRQSGHPFLAQVGRQCTPGMQHRELHAHPQQHLQTAPPLTESSRSTGGLQTGTEA